MAEINSHIVEREMFGEVVQIDKIDGVPVRVFGHRKAKDNPEGAPELPPKEPHKRAMAPKLVKPPETVAEQQSRESAALPIP